jgi:hypothetical protein
MQTHSREERRNARRSGPAVAAVGAIVVLGLVIPILIAAHYHAFGVPRSDDWSYLVSEFRWVDDGRLSFNHWVSMSLVGQLVLGAPIAKLAPRDIGALQVLTATLGLVGLLAVWLGARTAGIARGRAVLLALTIAVGPLWGPLVVSFMTDVPAFAASAVALALALFGLTRAPVRFAYLWGAVAMAVFACTIRQYSVVTLVAVLVAAWCAAGADRRARRSVVGSGLLAFALVVGFLVWWRTVPDGRSLSPSFPDVHAVSVTVSKVAGFMRLSALLLLPILVAARPGARLRAAWRDAPALTVLVAGGTAALLAITTLRAAADIFVGNYVVHDGALSDIVIRGPRPDVLPGPVWALVVAAASVAGVALAVIAAHAGLRALRWLAVRPRPAPDPVTVLLGVSVVGYLGGYLLAMMTGIQVYDRYILPVLPAAGILLLRAPLPAAEAVGDGRGPTEPARGPGTAAWLALVALAVLGFAFATDSASFDGARWRAAEAAVDRGWPVRVVAGGFEWRAFRRGDRYPPATRPRDCVVVKIEPRVAEDRVVAVVRSTAPTRRTTRFVAYRTAADCAVPARSSNPRPTSP